MAFARVIVANDLQSYREAITCALGIRAPEAEVFNVRPEHLDECVRKLGPQVVICTRTTPAVESGVSVWIELHPGEGLPSRVCSRGKVESLDNPRLDDLLALIEHAKGEAGGAAYSA